MGLWVLVHAEIVGITQLRFRYAQEMFCLALLMANATRELCARTIAFVMMVGLALIAH